MLTPETQIYPDYFPNKIFYDLNATNLGNPEEYGDNYKENLGILYQGMEQRRKALLEAATCLWHPREWAPGEEMIRRIGLSILNIGIGAELTRDGYYQLTVTHTSTTADNSSLADSATFKLKKAHPNPESIFAIIRGSQPNLIVPVIETGQESQLGLIESRLGGEPLRREVIPIQKPPFSIRFESDGTITQYRDFIFPPYDQYRLECEVPPTDRERLTAYLRLGKKDEGANYGYFANAMYDLSHGGNLILEPFGEVPSGLGFEFPHKISQKDILIAIATGQTLPI